jgi:hypothetical protein
MAHSSDRTLLASLGFQDPDRRDRTHTLACQYLCEKETAAKVGRMLWPQAHHPTPEVAPFVRTYPKPVAYESEDQRRAPVEPRGWFEMAPVSATTEVAIHKDRGFLVGFWDVRLGFGAKRVAWTMGDEIRADVEETIHYGIPRPDLPPTRIVSRTTGRHWLPEKVGDDAVTVAWIEVKSRPVDVADIARQLAVYEPFTHGVRGYYALSDMGRAIIIATCYPMSAPDKATLAAKGIRHIFLGDGFRAYVKARENEQADNGEGL